MGNNSVALALSRSGLKLKRVTKRWPKTNGVKGLRIEMKTGHLVEVVK
jgi:hypothetical protein